ncbi:MAG: transposase, partial [Pirellulales bacterium]
MPQTVTQLYVHLIFSTRKRRRLLDDNIRDRVHGYLATLVRHLDSPYVVVGGVADHVHILFEMGKLRAPADMVEHIKRASSKFVKTLGAQYQSFYWQRG